MQKPEQASSACEALLSEHETWGALGTQWGCSESTETGCLLLTLSFFGATFCLKTFLLPTPFPTVCKFETLLDKNFAAILTLSVLLLSET